MSATTRLYYTDSTVTEFAAVVVATEPTDGGLAVRLDRTAFYPTSGGQPNDTGSLGSGRVVDVVDREDGTVWHLVAAAPALPVGETVHGRVDWPRRFDHMQQHSGQHVLSAAFARLCAARTVGFHLGERASTIDFDRPLSPEQVSAGESAANVVVWDDRMVTVRFVRAAEAARLELRKPSSRTGRIRLVEIERCDLSACGGTHVGRSGAIGIIAVSSTERFKGGTRVGFVCGERALRHVCVQREQVAGCVRLLSVTPEKLGSEIERIQIGQRDQRRTIRALQSRLASFDAASLVAAGQAVGAATVVVSRLAGHDAGSLKAVAVEVARRPGHVAVLTSDARPVAVVVARAHDVELDAAAVIRGVLDRWDGRGGGRPEVAQGGGLDADPDEVTALARRLLSQALEEDRGGSTRAVFDR